MGKGKPRKSSPIFTWGPSDPTATDAFKLYDVRDIVSLQLPL